MGIIPTLAPYLLPLFLQNFTEKYENVKLQVIELTTENIVRQLKEGKIDTGILATPLHDNSIKEDILFHEKMIAYVSTKNPAITKSEIQPKDIDPNKLWLLEEGHCFRSQIINLCELKKQMNVNHNFEYEAGSIETLRRLVDLGDGVTIIPELATLDMSENQKKQLRYFPNPNPVREISIVTHRDFVKKRLVKALKNTVLESLPKQFILSTQTTKDRILPITATN